MTAFNPVFQGETCYVDFKLFSRDQFPALSRLDDLSEVEVLILAKLIVDLKLFKDSIEDTTFDDLVKTFENHDSSPAAMDNALRYLSTRDWVNIILTADEKVAYRANLLTLKEAGLYTPDYAATDSLTRKMKVN